MEFETFDRSIRWPNNAKRLAKFLIGTRQWFAIEPYPDEDGWYNCYVKIENESLLRGAIEYIKNNRE